MSSFVLKIIALISMFCDHFGDAYINHFSVLNLIGRCAFPIFAFQISEGFSHTKNIKKYFLRLGLFALISQIPFSLFTYKFFNMGLLESFLSPNVFFTLFFGLLSIFLYDYIIKLFRKKESISLSFFLDKLIGILVVLLIAYIAELLNTDYGFWGVIVTFMFYLFKHDKLAMIISFITLCIIKYGIQIISFGYNLAYVLLCIFTILPIIFICLYNGKQGKKIKYLLYFFYPLHLLFLYFIF